MSCQLNLIATFQELRAVKKHLFPNIHDKETDESELEGWDNSDWGWKADEPAGSDSSDDATLSWLQDCPLSLSPTGDLMAIGNDDKLVLLASKWDSTDEDVQTKYGLVHEGSLKQEEGEKITCVLCLPLASQKRSMQGGADWTCVLVGFSSGYVRMYTETGTLLLSQIFSEEPVQGIKCRTHEPPRHVADAEKHEELSILYKKSLVTIDGFSFFQSLRACRNQVARAAASGSEWLQPPPLAYKKWALHEQDQIVDHVACGMTTPNPFDQMQTGSMLGGYNATIRATPPASSLYVTAGTGPYSGFFYAVEGSTQPMLSDVAHAVASKLKSALFSQISAASGWFGLGGSKSQESPKEKKKPKIEPATSLPARFGLPDKRRDGESVVLSADNKLAATTDSFGRVILIDVVRGVAVRMWKGYRDAQVGFVEVKEDANQDREQPTAQPRRAQFLVIYASRRGILEVWAAQQGPRVAAFNVSKSCRLLCPGHGMMGLNNVTYKGVKVQLHQIYLLDPEGTVKSVEVPFHLALSDKNSKRARDMHLLKKLKIALKDSSTEGGNLQTEVVNTILDIKIASIRQQGLERVVQTKYLTAEFLQSVIKAVDQQLDKQAAEQEEAEGEKLDYESRMLQQYCRAQQHLLSTYTSLHGLNVDGDSAMDTENTEETVCRALDLSPERLKQLQSSLAKYAGSPTSPAHRVHFKTDADMNVVDFLGCFQCHLQREEKDSAATTLTVHLCSGLSETKLSRLANFLFKVSLERGTSSDFNAVLSDSHIPPEDLMSLLLHLWLAEDSRDLDAAVSLHTLVKSISCLKDYTELVDNNGKESQWWLSVRDTCSQSQHICSSLLAALVSKTVAMDMGKLAVAEHQMQSSTDSGKMDMSEWVSVTMDKAQWTMLLRQLEDLLALQCLLNMRPAKEGLITKPAWEPEIITVSVKKVLDGGKGVLPEVVAKWIAGQGILPSMLCLTQEEEEDEETKSPSPKRMKEGPAEALTPIIAQLQEVQHRLPHSLDADILMANSAWEYVVLWNKDPEVIVALQQALAYLRCIQNAVLQHGVGVMMWQMFMVKKLSSATFLMDKVGKAPKDRLCRKDVGLSEVSMEKFMGLAVELLETILQAREDSQELPMLTIEDVWQNVQGPTSLVELAVEQKETNVDLVSHHFCLCVLLHAILALTMKTIKPLSLFDSKGKAAFFKPLQSSQTTSRKVVDETIIAARKQFMCRVIGSAVQTLGERPSADPSSSPDPGSTSPSSPSHKNPNYQRWPAAMLRIAGRLGVDQEELRRQHVYQLYNTAHDKLAEEVLLTVSGHAVIGSQLLQLAGQRLHQFVFAGETTDSVEKVSKCSPTVSTWLKSLDATGLACVDPPLKDTAALIGHCVNQLPEGHSQYSMAIELVELVQSLL